MQKISVTILSPCHQFCHPHLIVSCFLHLRDSCKYSIGIIAKKFLFLGNIYKLYGNNITNN